MSSSLRCAWLLCTCLLLLSFSLPFEADAQSRKDRHRIRVAPEGESCVYEIQNQANQDFFVINPGGRVLVQAQRGLWVDVFVQNDPRGIPGTRNRRMVALRKQVPRDTLFVRSAIGRPTEHQVQIQCCLSRGQGRACPRWSDARPPTTETGRPDGGSSSVLGSTSDLRGPAASPPPVSLTDPPRPPGGPVMRIEEEQ